MTAPFFPGIRPRPSTLFATDFSEYPVGVPPADWTEWLNLADWNTLIETTAGSLFGKALKFNRTPQTRQPLVWNVVPLFRDAEILLREHKAENSDDNHQFTGPMVRMSAAQGGTGADLNGLWATLIEGHEDKVYSYVNGTRTQLQNAGGEHVGTGTGSWWWQRTRFVGNSIQTKHWKQGSAEPAYQPTVDTAGVVPNEGMFALFSDDFIDVLIDYLAISIGQADMPPAVIPMPV